MYLIQNPVSRDADPRVSLRNYISKNLGLRSSNDLAKIRNQNRINGHLFDGSSFYCKLNKILH